MSASATSADKSGHIRGRGHYSRNDPGLTHPDMTRSAHSIESKMSNGPSGALPKGPPARRRPNSGPISNGGGKASF